EFPASPVPLACIVHLRSTLRRAMKGMAILLGVALARPLAMAEVVEIPAVADCTIYQEAPSSNLGALNYLLVGAGRGESTARALLRFDLGEMVPPGATILRATLTMGVPVHLSFGGCFGSGGKAADRSTRSLHPMPAPPRGRGTRIPQRAGRAAAGSRARTTRAGTAASSKSARPKKSKLPPIAW
ncbi:MAG: hypothetical protein ABI680_05170, partial [Chthoniobacteraceae bacterium]